MTTEKINLGIIYSTRKTEIYVLFLSVTILHILIAVMYSCPVAILLYGCYLSGIYLCWYCLNYNVSVSKILLEILRFCTSYNEAKSAMCFICHHKNCNRHLDNDENVPWRRLSLDEDLNIAVENLLTDIINVYILPWYRQISDDEEFINEIRYGLRYSTANILKSFLNVDHAQMFSTSMLPHCINYMDYFRITSLNELDRSPDKTYDRMKFNSQFKIDRDYLNDLSSLIIPVVSPKDNINCKNYNILMRELLSNWLLLPLIHLTTSININTFDNISGQQYLRSNGKHNKKKVKFMRNFTKSRQQNEKFGVSLNTIIHNTHLLYIFMKFLKKTGNIHLLQFCLDAEELRKICTPKTEIELHLLKLHSEMNTLHNRYLSQTSSEFIGCPLHITTSFYQLLQDGPSAMIRLRHFRPLTAAYDFAFQRIENKWLALMFETNEFYEYICGPRKTLDLPTCHRTTIASEITMPKINVGLGKIRETFKIAQPSNDSIYTFLSEVRHETSGNAFRDLSSWHISLSNYEIQHKVVKYFINVTKLDMIGGASPKRWTVSRIDLDFFVLRSKLVEFHGEAIFSNLLLPTSGPMQIRLLKYENFIKQLLQKPCLRASDLLYTFLTTPNNFSRLVSSLPNNQDIGNIYRSMAYKLRKEKGQTLDTFLNVLLESIKVFKQENEWENNEFEKLSDDNKNTLRFKDTNNPKTEEYEIDDFLRESLQFNFFPASITESIFYLLKYTLHVPEYILRIYTAISAVSEESIEFLFIFYLRSIFKFRSYQPYCLYLLNCLGDTLFRHTYTETNASHSTIAVTDDHRFTYYLLCYLMNYTKRKGLLKGISTDSYIDKRFAHTLLELLIVSLYPEVDKQMNNTKEFLLKL